ncbi:MAG: DUF917 domain-containing protein [Thermoprotei archaeon]|nr:MAG: DUF917 domain-containing protein [Thermoprotei archaeon]
MFELSNARDIEDFIRGATLLGTGGGGDPKEGLKLLLDSLNQGNKLRVISLEELDEEDVVVSPYYVGTIAPTAKTRKPVKISDPTKVAFKTMEEVLGKEVSAVIACEIGGLNTAIPFYIGSKMELPVIDGDLLGRSAPELHQCSCHIAGFPMYPSVMVSETGNLIVIRKYSDIDDYEALARYVSVLAGRFVAVVDTPLTKSQLKKVIVPSTISLSLKVGRMIRESREKGSNPVEAAAEALNGWIVFEGVVRSFKWKDEGGFLIGEVEVKGSGRWSGRSLKSWIKNEHIFVWLDDDPIVMPPDIFALLKPDGEPVTNSELKEGMKVYGIAAKAPEIWRTPKGLELFGPRHFGFNYDYIPVEELVSRL